MEITGKIISALDPRSGVSQKTGNTWMTQEFVLETDDQYPRKVCFEVFGEDRLKQFNLQVGDIKTIHFDIDAHDWTTKDGQTRWTNQIRAWRVFTPGTESAAPAQQATAAPAEQPAPQQTELPNGDYSNMPF